MGTITKMRQAAESLDLTGDFTIADKVWTDFEEYSNSKELANRFEMYEHVLARRLASYKSYLTFVRAYAANDELYELYVTDDGLNILRLVSISSCVHNGGFRQVIADESGFYIGTQYYGKTENNRKLFIKRKMTVIS